MAAAEEAQSTGQPTREHDGSIDELAWHLRLVYVQVTDHPPSLPHARLAPVREPKPDFEPEGRSGECQTGADGRGGEAGRYLSGHEAIRWIPGGDDGGTGVSRRSELSCIWDRGSPPQGAVPPASPATRFP